MYKGKIIQTKSIDFFVRYKKNSNKVEIKYLYLFFDIKHKNKHGNKIEIMQSAYSKFKDTNIL